VIRISNDSYFDWYQKTNGAEYLIAKEDGTFDLMLNDKVNNHDGDGGGNETKKRKRDDALSIDKLDIEKIKLLGQG